MKSKFKYFLIASLLFLKLEALAQTTLVKSPPRADGEGPWSQLIIRGVTLINGTLSPPLGPVDIVVEKNRIAEIRGVRPGSKRVEVNVDGRELNAEGMYLLPGFVDTHVHIDEEQAPSTEYIFKLMMGHGVTTVADAGSGTREPGGLAWLLEEKVKSSKNEITAPRIKAYTVFGQGSRTPISTVDQALEWVHANAKAGADGIKGAGSSPEIIAAVLKENKKLGLRSKIHHGQTMVGRWNVLHSARAGLTAMEHWYGLPEALFADRTVQDYPLDYNYNNEFHRFGEAGKLWKQAALPFSDHWNTVMNELISLDFTLSPTLVIYSASRDLMHARRAEWHERYTLPSLWNFFAPSATAHGSYWFNWGTEQEIEWKENYRLWMTFLNEYKNRGGRVTVGTDAGYIYQLFGFSYITELEMLREAGFHPLEVIKAATLNGAESLGMEKEIGTVEVGKLADFVIVEENPLKNLQTLYGTGAIELNDNGDVTRVGGVKYTVKDGIIYDAKKLLNDVKSMVDKEKSKTNYKITQPGLDY